MIHDGRISEKARIGKTSEICRPVHFNHFISNQIRMRATIKKVIIRSLLPPARFSPQSN